MTWHLETEPLGWDGRVPVISRQTRACISITLRIFGHQSRDKQAGSWTGPSRSQGAPLRKAHHTQKHGPASIFRWLAKTKQDKSIKLFTKLSGIASHREAQSKWGERGWALVPASILIISPVEQKRKGQWVSPGGFKDNAKLFMHLQRRKSSAAPQTDEPHEWCCPPYRDIEQHPQGRVKFWWWPKPRLALPFSFMDEKRKIAWVQPLHKLSIILLFPWGKKKVWIKMSLRPFLLCLHRSGSRGFFALDTTELFNLKERKKHKHNTLQSGNESASHCVTQRRTRPLS